MRQLAGPKRGTGGLTPLRSPVEISDHVAYKLRSVADPIEATNAGQDLQKSRPAFLLLPLLIDN